MSVSTTPLAAMTVSLVETIISWMSACSFWSEIVFAPSTRITSSTPCSPTVAAHGEAEGRKLSVSAASGQ